MGTERDTKFLGAAKLIWQEIEDATICNESGDFHFHTLPESKVGATLLARRLYDFMAHIIDHPPTSVSDADDWNIPDLTAFPPL